MNGIKAKRQVAVFTADRYLYQKIKLELYGLAEVLLCPERPSECELVLIDADTAENAPEAGVRMSRRECDEGDISLPFSYGEVSGLLVREEKALTLNPEDGSAKIGGRKIRLTEVEYKLLSVILEKRGGYADRGEILRRVWNNSADGGVINVYVHYLREKLEADGEKIILSSRKYGYRISEKYAGGDGNA